MESNKILRQLLVNEICHPSLCVPALQPLSWPALPIVLETFSSLTIYYNWYGSCRRHHDIIVFSHREIRILYYVIYLFQFADILYQLVRLGLLIFIVYFWFINSQGRSHTLTATSTGVHPTVGLIVGPIVGPTVGSSKRPFDYRSNRLNWQFDRINVPPTVGPTGWIV